MAVQNSNHHFNTGLKNSVIQMVSHLTVRWTILVIYSDPHWKSPSFKCSLILTVRWIRLVHYSDRHCVSPSYLISNVTNWSRDAFSALQNRQIVFIFISRWQIVCGIVRRRKVVAVDIIDVVVAQLWSGIVAFASARRFTLLKTKKPSINLVAQAYPSR